MNARALSGAIVIGAAAIAGLSVPASAEVSGHEEQTPSPARLEIGRPIIRGAIPRELVLRVVSRRAGGIRRCLELEEAPSVALTMRIIIGPTGLVQHATFRGGSLRRPAARRCLLRRLNALDFGSHPAGIDIVDLPITLRSCRLPPATASPKGPQVPSVPGSAQRNRCVEAQKFRKFPPSPVLPEVALGLRC